MKNKKIDNIRKTLDIILKAGLRDHEKTERLIKAIMEEPGELGKQHGHLRRIK